MNVRTESRDWSLVWVDTRDAILVRWTDEGPQVQRFRSEVPSHRASTGHVRHDPGIRHGGGGAPQEAGEAQRHEHLARFLDEVAAALPATDVLVLGSGPVHEQLARLLAESDEEHRVRREVRREAAPRRTQAQLISQLRELRGEPPRRRSVGAHRWTGHNPGEARREPD